MRAPVSGRRDLVRVSVAGWAAVRAVQGLADVTRARRALTLFRRRDDGYAEARLIARGMVVDLCEAMVARWDSGLPVSGRWLDEALAQPAYQRTTLTDLFEVWARLTAQSLDEARKDLALARLVAFLKRPEGGDLEVLLDLRDAAIEAGATQNEVEALCEAVRITLA